MYKCNSNEKAAFRKIKPKISMFLYNKKVYTEQEQNVCLLFRHISPNYMQKSWIEPNLHAVLPVNVSKVLPKFIRNLVSYPDF